MKISVPQKTAVMGTDQVIHDLGNTPLLPTTLIIRGVPRTVYLKMEGANPTGSMKDRTGYALVKSLEEQGRLKKGSTIIESSSGNLGVALALYCRMRGCSFVAVVDPKTTEENIAKMQHFGARIEMVHQPDAIGGYLLSRLARVQELCSLNQDYIWTDQYSNPANPHVHYTQTGPEIYQQMEKNVDVIFVPVSTGGTLAGIGRFFREVSPRTRVIGVDAYGSVIFGTPPFPRKLTGIGSSKASSFINKGLYDEYMLVKDEEAFAFCRFFYAKTNRYLGGSSGAVLAACARYLAENTDSKAVVCVCADKGENYTSSIFNDGWIEQQRLDVSSQQVRQLCDDLF